MKKIFSIIVLMISIPILIINFFYSYKIEKVVTGIYENKIKNKTIRVLRTNGEVDEIDLEKYLVGVVSSEMPVYFEEEALKAQAVAARTYALKQMENNTFKEYDVTDDTSTQVYKSDEELKTLWKSDYEKNINKISRAIEETKGEYITYDDKIIYAFFFSTSNGYTEDNKNVFGQDLPYLKSVDSSFDKDEANNFIFSKKFDLSEFYLKLGLVYKQKLVVSDIVRSESNRILKIKINDNEFKGRDFQKKLELRSNDFEIIQEDNEVIITTKGFGHGVGMSQYGANALAKKKKNYKEIIEYYYKGTKLQKL